MRTKSTMQHPIVKLNNSNLGQKNPLNYGRRKMHNCLSANPFH